MTLNFPTSPSVNDTYTYQGTTFVWDGEKWDASNPFLVNTGNIVDDAVTGDKVLETTDLTVNDITANSLTLPTAPVVGYQRGFWLPSINTQNGANTWLVNGTPSASMGNWTATWSRIGQHVTLEWYLTILGAGTQASIFQITDIPYKFVPPTDYPAHSMFKISTGTAYTGGINLSTMMNIVSYMYSNVDGSNKNTTSDFGGVTFQLTKSDTSGNTSTLLGSQITASTVIAGNITYITDDTTWVPQNGATLS